MYHSDYRATMFGLTRLNDNLLVTWDYDNDVLDKKQRKPVFRYTPDVMNTDNHFHIKLDKEQAIKLRDWLIDYVNDVVT